jgi:hypothetical protein
LFGALIGKLEEAPSRPLEVIIPVFQHLALAPEGGLRWLPAEAVPDLGLQRKDAKVQRRKKTEIL